ncbi:MAG: hypothetical protein KDG89_08025 [Geminicoccaceae bacterium]|nr:hypothetical protein [Geminicoccaceae bacterium]
MNVLARAGRHATLVMAAGVLLGLALPPLAALFRPFLLPALLIPFTVALARIDLGALAASFRPPVLVPAAVLWSLLGSPLLTAFVAAPLDLPPLLYAALVVQAACAPLFSAAALALLLRLDASLALLVTLAATAFVPLSVPPLAFGLAGLSVDLDGWALTLRLVAIVGGGFLAARLARRVTGAERLRALAVELDGLAVLGFAAFALGIMVDVQGQLLARPGFVLLCLAAAVLLNAGLQALTALATLPFVPRRAALTLGLVAGNNNFGLVLAAMGGAAPADLVLFVAVAQLPIYLLPALQAPLYRRWLDQGSDP